MCRHSNEGNLLLSMCSGSKLTVLIDDYDSYLTRTEKQTRRGKHLGWSAFAVKQIDLWCLTLAAWTKICSNSNNLPPHGQQKPQLELSPLPELDLLTDLRFGYPKFPSSQKHFRHFAVHGEVLLPRFIQYFLISDLCIVLFLSDENYYLVEGESSLCKNVTVRWRTGIFSQITLPMFIAP